MNTIMTGAKSQKAYTRQQHAGWVQLVKTGKPKLNKPIYKETPEYLEYLKLKPSHQEKIDFLQLSRKAQRWVLEELKR